MNYVTNINQLDFNEVYSYADYLLWKFQERVELLKGRIFKMSPAPSRKHQEVSSSLHGEMYISFRDQPCKLYAAPFDVRLATKNQKDEEIVTVVQPDLCVICDQDKLDDRGCIGAPDLIVEILLPGNSKKEIKHKYDLYEEAGVKEYWTVHPLDEIITVYVLDKGKYRALKPIVDDYVTSELFPNLKIHTDEIFKN
ncbi:MAG: Uma2 family endonuclease [Flavobacteriaceae bacterium]|nr:Uma2 family endonuclease [Flavobacteriaceae bacterium]